MNYTRLFISYAHVDEVRISDLVEILRAADLDPWWDDRLKPGDDWKEQLKTRIIDSDAIVFVVSNDSLESEWCQWELVQASALSKPIIPILIRSGITLPQHLASLQYIDATSGFHNLDVARLVAKLAGLHQIYTSASLNENQNPSGFPSRFQQPLPKDYRTVTQAYFQPYKSDMYFYSWEDEPKTNLPTSTYVIGVDFGTTESSVAIYRNRICELIPNDLGEHSTPSAVAIASDGTPLTGRRAVDYLLQHPERGVLDIKRLLGSSFEKENDGDPVLEIDGIAYTPVHFVAFILRQLREDAQAFLRSSVSKAVITAPAFFDHSQYVSLMQAAKLAKLQILRVLPEPVAACMSVGFESETYASWLVYDLGGGTFDASVVEVGDGVFQVKAVNGDTRLGGADFDRAIVDYCVQIFKRTTGIDLSNEIGALIRIRTAAERAKIALSKTNASTIQVPYIAFGKNIPLHLDVKLTRTRYNELTQNLVAQTVRLTLESLEDSGYSKDTIDHALIVGLAARGVSVSTATSDLFGSRLLIAPDHVVALGAAVQGAVLSGKHKDTLLLDTAVHTLRIQLAGGRAIPVIVRNTTIPTREWITLSTQHVSQSKLLISILVGESSWADRNEQLTSIEIQCKSNNSVRFQVKLQLDIDANSDFKVSVLSVDGALLATSTVGLRWESQSSIKELGRSQTQVESMMPIWDEPVQLPPLTFEIYDDHIKLERWICRAASDLVLKRVGPGARGGWWLELSNWLTTHPVGNIPIEFTNDVVFHIFSIDRERLVDALEQFCLEDLSFVRRCMSIKSTVDALRNHQKI